MDFLRFVSRVPRLAGGQTDVRVENNKLSNLKKCLKPEKFKAIKNLITSRYFCRDCIKKDLLGFWVR